MGHQHLGALDAAEEADCAEQDRDDPRFHREDTSYRRIPKDAARSDLNVWHFGYPTRDAQIDPNCVFPWEQLKELEREKVVGELHDPCFSFMGGIYSARKVRT